MNEKKDAAVNGELTDDELSGVNGGTYTDYDPYNNDRCPKCYQNDWKILKGPGYDIYMCNQCRYTENR